MKFSSNFRNIALKMFFFRLKKKNYPEAIYKRISSKDKIRFFQRNRISFFKYSQLSAKKMLKQIGNFNKRNIS